MRTTDVIIVGQGLAGSTLAWRLAERGVRSIVLDRGGTDGAGRPAASRVAAGLITPVTGKRLTVADDFRAMYTTAAKFYQRLGKALRFSFFEERPAVRVFVDAAERELFDERQASGVLGDHARLASPGELPAALLAPHGGFVMPGAGRVNCAAYLAGTRSALIDEDGLVQDSVDLQRDVESTEEGVRIPRLGLTAKSVVFCHGYVPNPPECLPTDRWAPAKGEVVTIETDALPKGGVVHRGVWIAPCESGAAGRWRVGATHEWDVLDSDPTDAAREELLGRLAQAGLSGVSVVDHQAAVRPATSDRTPIVGVSDDGRFAWLNGLGAKGSLWAPTYADQLAERLADRR